MPVLPKPGRSQLPVVPVLRHQAQECLPSVQDAAGCQLAAVPALRDARDHRAADTAGSRDAGKIVAIDARRADAHTWLKSSARS